MPKRRKALTRSETMSRIRGRDTGPEVALRKLLWSRGHRYRKHLRVHGTRPDLVFPGKRLAVFVDGCFWHGCPLHFVAPRTRTGFWVSKIRSNVQRDRQQTLHLEELAWTVVRVWEHEIEADPQHAALAVEAGLAGRAPDPSPDWRVVDVEVTPGTPRLERWHLEQLRDPLQRRDLERRR